MWHDGPSRPPADLRALTFAGDASVRGRITTDTLILAKGHAYFLDQGDENMVVRQLLRAVGTACNPISVEPTTLTGSSPINFAPGASAAMDYVRLDRVAARGPQQPYTAGRNSVNVNGSSTGWVFETDPTVSSLNRFFLEEDREVCTDDLPALVPDVPDEFAATYLWQDSSTNLVFQPEEPGRYYLQITFDEGRCRLTDTVSVSAPDYALDLPEQVSACGVTEVRLDLPDPTAEGYAWSAAEGSILTTDATSVLVAAPGRYFLRQTLGACSDSTEVIVTAGQITSGATAEVCVNTSFVTPQADYLITADTTITEAYTTADGCDSLHTTTITLAPTISGASVAEICANTSFVTPQADYLITADTTITEAYATADGCDSLHTTTIILAPTISGASVAEICANTSFVTPQADYLITADTTITEAYATADGCDSLHTTTITLAPTISGTSVAEICANTSFVTPQADYLITANTTITEAYATADGCDSLHTTTITLAPTISGTSVAEICANTSFVTPQANYLITADTTITEAYATADGCDSLHTYTLSFLPRPNALDQATVTGVNCAGTADGTLRLPGDPGLNYFLDGQPLPADTLLTGLEAGNYQLEVATQNGCRFATDYIVSAPEPLAIDLPASVTVTEPGGTVLAPLVTGGTGAYAYGWAVADTTALTLSCATCPAPLLSGVTGSRVALTVLDAANCPVTATTEVLVRLPRDAYLPDAFSPNGDGRNDVLAVFGSPGAFAVEEAAVYDRWGGLRTQTGNAAPGQGVWDGAEAAAGPYLVVVTLRWPNGRREQVRKTVYLLR